MRKRQAIAGVAFGLLVSMSLLLPVQARGLRQHRHRAPFSAAASNVVTAKAAILIDNATGEVLWQRNPDMPLPPASTTKIVTAILALQSGRLDESVGVTAEAAEAPPSKIRLRAGWQMRLRDLVYAVLLNSANDASVAIAEGLSGSVRGFAERMNATAYALGARNTHFVNPNGLPAADHYSTARDLATMFSYAMQNPLFEQIIGTESTTVYPTGGSMRRIMLHTHNRLLGNYRIRVVGKTGWTIAAKKCFVGAASADGHEVVVAVLGSRDLWGDVKRLVEFGFRGTDAPNPAALEGDSAAALSAGPSAAGDEDESARVTATSQRYWIQLAAFRQLRSATHLRDTVEDEGYSAHVSTIRQGRHHAYRVIVGSYPTRHSAEEAAQRLRKTHDVRTIIARN